MLNRLWWWRAAFGLATLGILALALMPGEPGADWFNHADKVRHAAAFLVLWAIGRQARFEPAWGLALSLLAFGVGIECAQAFTPTRESSLGDVVADAVGIAVGRLVWRQG